MIQITTLINRMIERQCSDLYILPMEKRYRIVATYHGQIGNQQVTFLPQNQGEQMIGYFKYRANMAVSEHRRPQSGACRWWDPSQRRWLDLRLSTIGDYRTRESLVIRFIYPLNDRQYHLAFDHQWTTIQQMLIQRGLVLFAGPMGSGKTTTMYRLARQQAQNQVVMTIEDPIEIAEPAFLQLQVNHSAQMDYQDLLRAGLRHRPDIFIIGEIRDPETAQMAVQAALSGHLVLATIHAQSSRGVLARLQQLAVPTYYLEQSLSGICYQRLLPNTAQEQMVLFDLLDRKQIGYYLNHQSTGGVSDDWQKRIQTLQKEKQITAATATSFQWG